jgi:hypothetical protein
MFLVLDNNPTTIQVNSTISGDGVSPLYRADNMEDRDHQFRGDLYITGAPFEMDYFECVTPLLYTVPKPVRYQFCRFQD